MSRTVREVYMPRAAMILAAGLGTRMRPLTDTRPKPLVELAGKALIDHVLDRLETMVIDRVVVNVHYRADQLIAHLAARRRPRIRVSDERGALLDTGGGIVRALPLIGGRPFYLINADTAWRDHRTTALHALAAAYDEHRMDALLLLADPARSIGYDGPGDFVRSDEGRLRRATAGDAGARPYMGIAILHPRLFRDAPHGAFSLNLLLDRAIAAGRLHGLPHDGYWMHVGTPQALAATEEFLAGGRA